MLLENNYKNHTHYEIYTDYKNKTKSGRKIKELLLVNIYSNIYNKKQVVQIPKTNLSLLRPRQLAFIDNQKRTILNKKKRGYIKHLVRLRYRWHFRHELGEFKSFRKFFKRSIKRYRKIRKNELFITKFHKNFSKLTGFNRNFFWKKWQNFRRNYNQYWSNTNMVLKFSQSLMLAPYTFLVIMNICPSTGVAKHIIRSGAISINGKSATVFNDFKPGDILQINLQTLDSIRKFFQYQRWNFRAKSNNCTFMYTDWSSMLFTLTRWPYSFELLAPSFLSERWIRYYVRTFPSKVAKFKSVNYNTKVYKTLLIKK